MELRLGRGRGKEQGVEVKGCQDYSRVGGIFDSIAMASVPFPPQFRQRQVA